MSLTIDISSQLLGFKKHLEIPNNTRILFSGPFGSGKTYFIEKFFKENEDEYIKIKINPVHYSVASNEDIFELIKYDILFELLGRPEIDEIEDGNPLSLVLASFIQSKQEEIGKFGAPSIGLVDPILGKIGLGLLTISNLMDKFGKFKSNTSKPYPDQIIEFLRGRNRKPGIREEDLITILLCEIIALVKAKSEKKIVLVIDDLDRIDPEHIFRIFNVFGAHFDIIKDGNKFDFDHVVLVCDENNILNIFKTKYGVNVDYNGYINKFFSKEIYIYDNFDSILNSLEILLAELPSTKKDFVRGNYVYDFVKFILITSIKLNLIQLRSLVKLESRNLSGFKGYFRYSEHDAVYLYVCEVFEILGTICGGQDTLMRLLFDLSNSPKIALIIDSDGTFFRRKMEGVIVLLAYARHNFDEKYLKSDVTYYDESAAPMGITFKLKQFGSVSSSPIIHATDIRTQYGITSKLFFEFLVKSYMNFVSNKVRL